ncbi:alpha/beta fold hydrolase [Rhizobium sp. 2YAF20]|uniref:alpha/beta fold hydrolase n=1 Tax=Rhizobium sp. 2YAF20 TaxID=3233027 RepID=UPI003F9E5AD7
MNLTHYFRAGLNFSVHESGSGEPMVFQHGLCGDAKQPAAVFPDDIGWHCLTLECRGHGSSDIGPHGNLSIATFADDLAALIEERQITPVIGGISMGAAIALRLAVTRPELVQALVLARPAWLDTPNPSNMQPNAIVGQLLHDFLADEARFRFEASDVARTLAMEAPDNLASLRGFFGRRPLSDTAELLCRISSDGPGVSMEQIRSIGVPTLVIGHARDFVHPISYARTLAEWISNARFVEITPKADSPQQYQNDFRAALATFLEEL